MGTITTFMERDHDDINRRISAFLTEVKGGASGVRSIRELTRRIERHIQLEERAIFTCFERYTKLEQGKGVLAVMQRDHDVIRGLLKDAAKACETKVTKKIMFSAQNLRRAMDAHEKREMASIYPISDKAMTKREWEAALKRTTRSRQEQGATDAKMRWYLAL